MTTFDFEREEEIELALAEAVKTYPPPTGLKEAIRERLFGKIQVLASPESCPAGMPSAESSVADSAAWPRRLTPRRMAGYASGLAIVASLLVMLAMWGGRVDLGANVAFADVQEAIRDIETAIAVLDCPQTPWMNHRVLYRSDCEVVREEWPNGDVSLHDTKQGRELVLDPKKKTVRIQDRGRGGAGFMHVSAVDTPREFLAKLAEIEQIAVTRLGEREIDGRKLVGFMLPRDSNVEDVHMLCHVWVDPQTRLPVRYEFLPEDPGDLAASFRQYALTFTFNRPLGVSLFRLVPPEGYTVLHEVAYYMPYLDRLPLPPKDEKLASPIIVPGVGIGQARFGMSVEEVIDVLGRPDDASYCWIPTPEESRHIDEVFERASKEVVENGLKGGEKSRFINEAINRAKLTKRTPNGMYLDYVSRGFQLVVLIDQGLIHVSCVGEDFGKRPFTGKTFEGIGMGATMQEIENAYGPASATSEQPRDGVQCARLNYTSMNMLLQLRDGRLWELSFDKPPAPKSGTDCHP